MSIRKELAPEVTFIPFPVTGKNVKGLARLVETCTQVCDMKFGPSLQNELSYAPCGLLKGSLLRQLFFSCPQSLVPCVSALCLFLYSMLVPPGFGCEAIEAPTFSELEKCCAAKHPQDLCETY